MNVFTTRMLDYIDEKYRPGERFPSKSCVYFLQFGSFIKIGASTDVLSRLQLLQRSYLQQTKDIKTIGIFFTNGGHSLEREVHTKFESLQVTKEIFSKSDDITIYINNRMSSMEKWWLIYFNIVLDSLKTPNTLGRGRKPRKVFWNSKEFNEIDPELALRHLTICCETIRCYRSDIDNQLKTGHEKIDELYLKTHTKYSSTGNRVTK